MNYTETGCHQKYAALDLMRGMAALIVALVHFKPYGMYDINALAGGLSVSLFFVLSGFVLSHAYGAEIANNDISFLQFTVIRIARLYPLHFLTFTIVFAYYVLLGMFRKYGIFDTAVKLEWDFIQVIENATMTHLIFQDAVSFNSPSWSVGVEFWCGMLIYFIFCQTSVVAKRIIISLIVFSYMAICFNWEAVASNINKNYFSALFLFLLGCMLHSAKSLCNKFQISGAIGFAVGVFVLGLMLFPPVDNSRFREVVNLYCIIYVLMIFVLVRVRINRTLSRIGDFLGDISFGIYLWHVPVALALVSTGRFLEKFMGYKLVGGWLITALFVALTGLVSYFGHRLYERPMQRWIRLRWLARECAKQ